MIEDTYKGESPGKKLARMLFWSKVSIQLGHSAFRSARILVLASREGGDVSALTGMHVPIQNITACEYVAEAASACAERWPSLRLEVCDVFEHLKRKAQKYDVVLLDFCHAADDPTMRRLGDVMCSMRSGAMLGACFLRGRERSFALKIHRQSADRKERAAMDQLGLGPDAMGTVKPDGSRGGPFDGSRYRQVQQALFNHGLGRRVVPLTSFAINYHSRSKNGHGVPMAMMNFKVWKDAPSVKLEAFKRRGWQREVAHQNWAESVDFPVWSEFYCSDTDETEIRATALRLTETNFAGREHLLLNIPKATIAAWKAHATRGTYAA